MKVLVLEDDQFVQRVLISYLKEEGHQVLLYSSFKELKNNNESFDLAFIDLDLEANLIGLKALECIAARVKYKVVFTGHDEFEIIAKAYEAGADDFITKPFDRASISSLLRRASITINGSRSSHILKDFKTTDESLMAQIMELETYISSKSPILLLGPTGVGKTTLAEVIHKNSDLSGEFIHVNCSEFSEQLLESEIFGHVKGAFTGADQDKVGKLKLADHGTLFLDELSSMPEYLQNKLLKAIEKKSFYPVGSDREVRSDFRVVSATCDSLDELIGEGSFRSDLYYRLSGYTFIVPALENRKSDVEYFIHDELAKSKRKIHLKEDAYEELLNYSWPGNVRELVHVMKKILHMNKGVISKEDLQLERDVNIEKNDLHSRIDQLNIPSHFLDYAKENSLRDLVEKIEEFVLYHSFKYNDEKVRRTADDLRLSTNSFYKIMKRVKQSLEDK